MVLYIIKRLLQLIPILFGITFMSFGMMHIAGSDAVTQKFESVGIYTSRDVIDEARAELGLDRPFLSQYLSWLKNFLAGDMGRSYITDKDVFDTFVSKLPATLLLTVASVILTTIISIPLGVLAAVHRNNFTDYAIRLFSFVGNSIPNFFIALLLMYIFSIKLRWLPVISRISRADIQVFRATFPVDTAILKSAVLPTLTLSLAMSAKYTRQVRATVLEELSKPYVAGARARGVRFSVTLRKSVMRASLVTIVTMLTLSTGSLLGGTAIVESIFMWDGVGKLAVDALNMRDYPMIQAYVVWMAIIYVLINLITDILYVFIDPRVKLGSGGI